ncbi:MAG: hypothetical protein EHM84_01730 [Lysobacterales bacterium]|nr:MAG: hypothetical protein EHM84_01730 [Xanthomonadales bacterium]
MPVAIRPHRLLPSRLRRLLTLCVIATAMLFTLTVSASSTGDEGALVNRYLDLTAARLATPARTALRQIHEAPRQLLATRSYLMAGAALTERWSWSEEEIESFARTPEHRALLAEIERVRTTFEQQNPGHSLFVNTQARSLNVQLSRWNENRGVARVAQQLHSAAIKELQQRAYPATPDVTAVDRFAEFLRSWRPPVAAPLAAPGLSRHGQSRAIDFQVVRAGQIVAGTEVASVRRVWEAEGWGRRLRRAVGAASFVGPLKSPNEPWHYEYVGSAQQARLQAAGDALQPERRIR